MGEFSKVDIDGHLMIVTINRPEVYNACHPPASQELGQVFEEFDANPDLWVAIVTGAGDKAFCAGNDLKYHAEMRAKTGKRPSIFLANLGPIAKHTARASFAKNFFEVGGIEGLTNTGFKDVESCAKAFKDSGAKIAILCSADPLYEEMVATVAPALKAAGCQRLYLAGHPGDKKDAYMKAGVDDFIFLGADVLVITRSALAQLGAIDQ